MIAIPRLLLLDGYLSRTRATRYARLLNKYLSQRAYLLFLCVQPRVAIVSACARGVCACVCVRCNEPSLHCIDPPRNSSYWHLLASPRIATETPAYTQQTCSERRFFFFLPRRNTPRRRPLMSLNRVQSRNGLISNTSLAVASLSANITHTHILGWSQVYNAREFVWAMAAIVLILYV